MKPHNLSDLANTITALARDYGSTEQFRERLLDILLERFTVEHENRGPERERLVLVDAEELAIYKRWEDEARRCGYDSVRWEEYLALNELDALRKAAPEVTA